MSTIKLSNKDTRNFDERIRDIEVKTETALNGYIDDIEQAKANIGTVGSVKADIEGVIATGNTLKQGLEADIVSGNNVKATLDNSVSSANQKVEEVNGAVNNAQTAKQNLENVIATADTTTYATKGDFNNIANKTAVNINHIFADNAARDTYFSAHPTELAENLFISVGSGFQQRLGGIWVSKSAVVSDTSNMSFPATNLVTNGDFSNGATGWIGIDSVNSGIAEKTATLQYDNISYSLANPISLRGHKLYVKAKFKADTANAIRIAISDAITQSYAYHSGSNQFETKSAILAVSMSSNAVYCRIQDTRASGWTKFYADNFICLDLTAIFGEGNEPTAEEMDLLLLKFPNSWFDGTVNPLLNHKELYSYMDKRVDLKASVKQEDWITPTLLNGWTSVSGYDVQYMKDSFGFVHLKGRITGGASFTNIFSLPTSYKPKADLYIRLFKYITSASSMASLTSIVTGGGVVYSYQSANNQGEYLCLDGIAFPTF